MNYDSNAVLSVTLPLSYRGSRLYLRGRNDIRYDLCLVTAEFGKLSCQPQRGEHQNPARILIFHQSTSVQIENGIHGLLHRYLLKRMQGEELESPKSFDLALSLTQPLRELLDGTFPGRLQDEMRSFSCDRRSSPPGGVTQQYDVIWQMV